MRYNRLINPRLSQNSGGFFMLTLPQQQETISKVELPFIFCKKCYSSWWIEMGYKKCPVCEMKVESKKEKGFDT